MYLPYICLACFFLVMGYFVHLCVFAIYMYCMFFSGDGLFCSFECICVITVLISNHFGSYALVNKLLVLLLNGDCLYLP